MAYQVIDISRTKLTNWNLLAEDARLAWSGFVAINEVNDPQAGPLVRFIFEASNVPALAAVEAPKMRRNSRIHATW